MDNARGPVVLQEPALADLPGRLDPDQKLIHFKLVDIGPNAFERIGGKEKAARKIMAEQPNFYILVTKEDMRAALHAYVDIFCDAQGE